MIVEFKNKQSIHGYPNSRVADTDNTAETTRCSGAVKNINTSRFLTQTTPGKYRKALILFFYSISVQLCPSSSRKTMGGFTVALAVTTELKRRKGLLLRNHRTELRRTEGSIKSICCLCGQTSGPMPRPRGVTLRSPMLQWRPLHIQTPLERLLWHVGADCRKLL